MQLLDDPKTIWLELGIQRMILLFLVSCYQAFSHQWIIFGKKKKKEDMTTSLLEYMKNEESTGVPFPRSQPMNLHRSLWNAGIYQWATSEGLVKQICPKLLHCILDFNATACLWRSGLSSCASKSTASSMSILIGKLKAGTKRWKEGLAGSWADYFAEPTCWTGCDHGMIAMSRNLPRLFHHPFAATYNYR